MLETDSGPIFVKGANGRPFAGSLRNEAATNPYVRGIAPALLWQFESEGWIFLGFEHVDGRHADFAPGSPDLALLRDALERLRRVPLPPHATMRVERHYGGEPAMTGEALLHTDLTPPNVLVAGERAVVVDWAWACRGAPWVELAMVVFRLMLAGHGIEDAEKWGAAFPTWIGGGTLSAFVAANERLWRQTAEDDPQSWKLRAARLASRWADEYKTRNLVCTFGYAPSWPRSGPCR